MGSDSAIFDPDAPTIEVSVGPSNCCGGVWYNVLVRRNSVDDDIIEDPVNSASSTCPAFAMLLTHPRFVCSYSYYVSVITSTCCTRRWSLTWA